VPRRPKSCAGRQPAGIGGTGKAVASCLCLLEVEPRAARLGIPLPGNRPRNDPATPEPGQPGALPATVPPQRRSPGSVLWPGLKFLGFSSMRSGPPRQRLPFHERVAEGGGFHGRSWRICGKFSSAGTAQPRNPSPPRQLSNQTEAGETLMAAANAAYGEATEYFLRAPRIDSEMAAGAYLGPAIQ
jgi:hypothetical protein